ncbi:MAG: TlpA family protein disulfide reductase [Roseivirga sp.]|nr:TlpA family protein disulfide reductase [Roseivirga sp.]
MTRLLLLSVFICFFGNAQFAQDSTFDLFDFLEKYTESMKKLRSIEFLLEVKSETVQVKGRVLFDKGLSYVNHRFSFVGEISTPQASQKIGYSDNNEHFMTYRETQNTMSEVEPPKVRVYEKFGPALMSAGPPLIGSVVNSPFTNSPHYGKIREGDKVDFKGFEEVEGVSCVKLLVSNDKRQHTYFIGREDHLLRRVVTRRSMYSKSETTTSYNIISTNRKFTDEQFDLGLSTGKGSEKGGVLALGTEAPDFRLKNLKGEWVSLSDYEGMTVLIDFWGTWCKPCIRDIPELNALHESMSDEDFVILAVSAHEKNEDAVRLMAEKKDMRYTVLENGEEVSKKYHIDSYPTLVLVDSSGKVILTKGSGGNKDEIGWEALAEFIRTNY